MMRLRPSALAFLVFVLAASPAAVRAADPAVNAGAIEVIGFPGPEHLGVYPYLAFSLTFPLGTVNLIPALGVEASPDVRRWGFAGTFTADFPVSDRLGVDAIAGVIHDQDGLAFRDAIFLAGLGGGVSITAGHLVVSPSIMAFKGINVSGWSLVPGLNLSWGF
jgi:hypothetical protein